MTAKLGVGKYAREQESIFFASLPWPQYDKNTPSTGSRVLHLKWYEMRRTIFFTQGKIDVGLQLGTEKISQTSNSFYK